MKSQFEIYKPGSKKIIDDLNRHTKSNVSRLEDASSGLRVNADDFDLSDPEENLLHMPLNAPG